MMIIEYRKKPKEYDNKWKRYPGIGMRMIKSAVAVFVCFAIYILRGQAGVGTQSIVTSMLCMQTSKVSSKKVGINQIIGTIIGAVFGGCVLYTEVYLFHITVHSGWKSGLFIAIMLIPVLYTTVCLKVTEVSFLSAIVFLGIVLNISETQPFLNMYSKVIDTFIGVFVAIFINSLAIPRKKKNDILFISELDDTLISEKSSLSPYSKVMLNRMIEEGAHFTICTQRTPAALLEVVSDIKLNHPVIAMDGALLYDVKENCYLKVYVISYSTTEKILYFFESKDIFCFTTILKGDQLLTYYNPKQSQWMQNIYEEARKSHYRHYVGENVPKGQDAIHFTTLLLNDDINRVCTELQATSFANSIRVVVQEHPQYYGYSYLRIYNKNAIKENMISYLCDYVKLEKSVTFGNVDGKYDVVVTNGDMNQVVRTIKKQYEPPIWYREKK